MTDQRIIILPGNGNSHIDTDNWYSWLKGKLIGTGHYVIAKDMPDPDLARSSVWLPHIENVYQAKDTDIIVGHSSGAVAAMRYLESHKLAGVVLIGACYTDLGDEHEKLSGYYDSPWQWEKIKENAEWIAQFASADDPYIPIEEPRFIHEKLNSEYFEYTDRGHFMFPRFPELFELLENKVSSKA